MVIELVDEALERYQHVRLITATDAINVLLDIRSAAIYDRENA